MFPAKIEKQPCEHNPLITQRYVADPSVLVEDDRVYVYMTADRVARDEKGNVLPNRYGDVDEISIISTADFCNWTDHGILQITGEKGIAKWADFASSPAIVRRTRDGKSQFYLYFADRDKGIGVLVGDGPLGPFRDELGAPLVSHETENCEDVPWIASPAVLLDNVEPERAYLYFGGGIAKDSPSPQSSTLRVVKLHDDMMSLVGAPTVIDVPCAYESSSINIMSGKYVFSYCTGWNVDAAIKDKYDIGMAQIVYAVGESPMGPFRVCGTLLRNPGEYFGCYGNNRHEMFRYRDRWYIAYQSTLLENQRDQAAGYRCVHMDRVQLSEDGMPMTVVATRTGIRQTDTVDAFSEQRAAMFASSGAVEVRTVAEDGQAGDSYVCAMRAGGWTRISGVAFGSQGATRLRICYQAQQEQVLRVFCDGFSQMPIAEVTLMPSTNERTISAALAYPVKGTHDLLFLFSKEGTSLFTWQFDAQKIPAPAKATATVQGENPIIPMDFPDPDVIRVGDTYYMVSTTMHFIPGCALLRSYDLIHWELITHLCPDMGNTAAQRMEDGQNIYGQGMWAASIRYYAGTFYVSFVERDIGKTFLLRTEDPAGVWQRNELEGYYYDSSLLFDDDGRIYIVHGNATVRITELNEALTGPKKGGLDRVLVKEKDNRFLGYEGSHIQKIGDMYYLFLIHSLPNEWKRAQACYRSGSLHSRFIGGDVLCDDMKFFGQGIAQGRHCRHAGGRLVRAAISGSGRRRSAPYLGAGTLGA